MRRERWGRFCERWIPHLRDALTRATAGAGRAFAGHRGCGTCFRAPPRVRDALTREFSMFVRMRRYPGERREECGRKTRCDREGVSGYETKS